MGNQQFKSKSKQLFSVMQDFAKECVDQKSGARVKGMPQQIERCSDLVDILTSIIFVCGPGHGAINFSQYEYMAFTPNMPLAVYQDVQLLADQDAPITEQQLMAVSNPLFSPVHLCSFLLLLPSLPEGMPSYAVAILLLLSH